MPSGRRRLEKALRAALSYSIAPGGAILLGALGGCAGEDDGTRAGPGTDPAAQSPLTREGYESPPGACGLGVESLETLRVALGADWVGVRGRQVLDAGTPCASATDRAACEAKIAEVGRAVRNPPLGSGRALATSKGDEVRVHGEDANVLTPVDSPVKAFYVVEGTWAVGCDRWIRPTERGFEVIGRTTTSDCDPVITSDQRLLVKPDGTVEVLETREVSRQEGVCIGRRPEGLTPLATAETCALAGYFARAAYLEAASVHAFARLRDELAAHGAPPELVERAEEARLDEVRHAAMMSRLARGFGAATAVPEARAYALRDLLAIAIENAVEGCVRETYGALEAELQARNARDPRVRSAIGVIAADELRHAALGWDVAEWAAARLGADERAAIRAAIRDAARDLRRDLERAPDPLLADAAGLPDRQVADRAHAMLTELLWS